MSIIRLPLLFLWSLIFLLTPLPTHAALTFWTWDPPPKGHPIWANPNFRYMIHVMMSYGTYDTAGDIAADIVRVWNRAVANGYRGNAALLLQNWAQDTKHDIWLLDEKADAIPGTTWNFFFAHGKDNTARWSQNLVDALRRAVNRHNSNSAIAPLTLDYLHMDYEPHAHSAWHSTSNENVLTRARKDPRWAKERVLGNRSFADLWGRGFSYRDDITPASPENWAVQNWLATVYMKIDDALLDEVLYQPMRRAFPGIKCGNYAYYVSRSNVYPATPKPGSAFTDTSLLQANNPHYWLRIATNTLKGDVSTPVFYGETGPQAPAYDPWWKGEMKASPAVALTDRQIDAMSSKDIFLYVLRENARRAVAAVEGTDIEVIPWVDARREAMAVNLRDVLRICHEAGITKVLLFTGQDPPLTRDEWTVLSNILDSVDADTPPTASLSTPPQ